jgi:2-dehydro-3-deoxygalactonokinase
MSAVEMHAARPDAALIALDWGTTNLRGWLLDAQGTVLEARDHGPGIMQVENARFADALQMFCGAWLERRLPIIACGMIGSRQGAAEVPYLATPTDLSALSDAVKAVTVGQHTMHIVPGLVSDGTLPDVLRGEETQVLGASSTITHKEPPQDAHPVGFSGLFVLPGTHSKWVQLENGQIQRFRTFMTGEVYAALTRHTILGRLMPADLASSAPIDLSAFEQGAQVGLADPSLLLHYMFAARTLGLTRDWSGEALAAWLSGLLIGCEVGAGLQLIAHGQVMLAGRETLVGLYNHVFRLAGIDAQLAPSDCAVRGLFAIARAHQGLMMPLAVSS